jgi:hypothetical protein
MMQQDPKKQKEPMSLNEMFKKGIRDFFKEKERKVPIKKGCHAAAHGGCFCTGACQEIIGYRDKLPNEI